ncbi:MAG: hypothetical protein J6T25_04330 [Bacilli bacterium]|nr:hypothetical protein [Bacilli bacterium]
MILIVGNQHDDILYFESVMSNKKEELILGKYPVTVGTIFNQGVVLVDQVKTNYVSSALILHLIEKYFIFLIFNVGRCIAFTHDVKPSEIAISKRVVAGDVDQINEDNVKFGQIPGYEQVFVCQDDVIGYLTDAFEKRTFSKLNVCNYISTSVDYHRVNQVDHLKECEHLLGFANNVVFDNNSAGLALAADLKKVPFVSVKVIERYIDGDKNINTYLKALKEYTNIGKAVVTCIGDIGHNEVITEGGGK